MAYVTKITRTYSKSINLKTYGLPEGWIKIESTQEAQCESNDDALVLSKMLADSVQRDVVSTVNEIVKKIQDKQNAPVAVAATPGAPIAPTGAPVQQPPKL